MTTERADTVVLSAGAIHSPAILLRSGVGPRGHLRSLGIDVRADLPVGLGLQDHPMALISLPLTGAAAIKTPRRPAHQRLRPLRPAAPARRPTT